MTRHLLSHTIYCNSILDFASLSLLFFAKHYRQGTRTEPKVILFDYQIVLSWDDYKTVADSTAPTITPDAKKSDKTFSGIIFLTHQKQRVGMLFMPTSQFEKGIVKNVKCQVTTEKLALECEQSGEEFVVSAYSKVPVAKFSILPFSYATLCTHLIEAYN